MSVTAQTGGDMDFIISRFLSLNTASGGDSRCFSGDCYFYSPSSRTISGMSPSYTITYGEFFWYKNCDWQQGLLRQGTYSNTCPRTSLDIVALTKEYTKCVPTDGVYGIYTKYANTSSMTITPDTSSGYLCTKP